MFKVDIFLLYITSKCSFNDLIFYWKRYFQLGESFLGSLFGGFWLDAANKIRVVKFLLRLNVLGNLKVENDFNYDLTK